MSTSTDIANQLFSIRDYLRWGASEFNRAGLYYGHGSDNAYDEARVLLCHVLQLSQDLPADVLDARLSLQEREQLLALYSRRISERIPAAYLTRQSWFAGLDFYVDERVLVPRSPFAELIEQGFEPWLAAEEPVRILDLCTGSGCIGIACGYAFESADIDLVDISEDALNVAATNIARHGLEERVQAIHSDGFAALAGKTYDLIVSNPPYVDADDLASMPPEYHREPPIGLGSGVDGLELTRKILRDAAEHLSDHGQLFVEVGNSWASLEHAFPSVPFTWLEFERGGHGVFTLSKQELVEYQSAFKV